MTSSQKPSGRYLLAALAVFCFLLFSDSLIHGVLLKPLYVQTAHLWRPEAEMRHFFTLIMVYQGALAFISTFIFSKHYEARGIGEGVRFGVILGLLWAVMKSASYAWLPIPSALAMLWFLSGLGQGILSGVLMAIVYGRGAKSAAAPRK